jgi:hypothetical protein
MSVILFSAFCLEAYLNHIGSFNVQDWDEVKMEEPKVKIKSICDHIEYPLDLGRRPFQSFTHIMKYRNLMVHAKSEFLQATRKEKIDFRSEIPEMELADWEKITTLDYAEKYFEDTGLMIMALHKAAAFEGDPFLNGYIASWKITPIIKEDQ